MKNKKTYVHIEKYGVKHGNGYKCSGRLLGLITAIEFFNIEKSRRARRKVFSSETMPLSKIFNNYDKLDGMRLVMALKSENGTPVTGQKLFVTTKLSMISYSRSDSLEKTMVVVDENDDYITIEENTTLT